LNIKDQIIRGTYFIYRQAFTEIEIYSAPSVSCSPVMYLLSLRKHSFRNISSPGWFPEHIWAQRTELPVPPNRDGSYKVVGKFHPKLVGLLVVLVSLNNIDFSGARHFGAD
jgi:hypothetical protein